MVFCKLIRSMRTWKRRQRALPKHGPHPIESEPEHVHEPSAPCSHQKARHFPGTHRRSFPQESGRAEKLSARKIRFRLWWVHCVIWQVRRSRSHGQCVMGTGAAEIPQMATRALSTSFGFRVRNQNPKSLSFLPRVYPKP